jgi:hypothetical protein
MSRRGAGIELAVHGLDPGFAASVTVQRGEVLHPWCRGRFFALARPGIIQIKR